ncbi:hypothetical protein C0Q70_14499 [Pomacea canaliculata]|uniref:EGF-like domain-containing protein n=1 Tax=Pomacea canaliculata TaxID=400727 RepID=A0A2T7NS81_POMCA|nr:hypothetical protein C0Q70_14499 [Pomacea canaliculata]
MSPTTLYCLLGLVLIVPDAVIGAMFQEDCSVNNICISGYACEIDLQICLATPGQQCNTTTDCVYGASCSEGICYCNSGYRPFLAGFCEHDDNTRLLGEPCSDKRPCNHGKKVINLLRATKASSLCLTSTECVSHSTCDWLEGCVCDSGYTANEAGLCGPSAGGSSGDYCSSQTPCLSGYVCIEHTCYADVGVACSDSLQCANGICDSEQKQCLLPQYYRCQTSASCVSHATCASHGHCMCNTGYTPNRIGLCEAIGNQVANPTTSPTSVENSTQAVANSTQAVANSTQAVANSSHAVETSSHAVETSSHAVETSSHAVETSSHAVETSTHAVETSSHAVETSTHAVETSSHAVETSTRLVEGSTTISNTCSGTSTFCFVLCVHYYV